MQRRIRPQISFTLAAPLWAGCGGSASEEAQKTYPDGKSQELAWCAGSVSDRMMTGNHCACLAPC